jgi:hypothetical protein
LYAAAANLTAVSKITLCSLESNSHGLRLSKSVSKLVTSSQELVD